MNALDLLGWVHYIMHGTGSEAVAHLDLQHLQGWALYPCSLLLAASSVVRCLEDEQAADTGTLCFGC